MGHVGADVIARRQIQRKATTPDKTTLIQPSNASNHTTRGKTALATSSNHPTVTIPHALFQDGLFILSGVCRAKVVVSSEE